MPLTGEDRITSQSGLLRDADWRLLDGALLRLTAFTPLLGAEVRDGVVFALARSVPYATVEIACSFLAGQLPVTSFITHKLDFVHIWCAFAEDAVRDGRQEVLGYWTKRHYSGLVARLLVHSMPRFMVMTCPAGTFDRCKQGLKWPANEAGMVLINGLDSVKWWKSDLMA